MAEGPPGCDWEAVVQSVQPKQPSASVEVVLTKMQGSCMHEPGPCGEEGDLVFAPLGTHKASEYPIGKTVHVWMDDEMASLTAPACTRTPAAKSK